VRPYRSGKDVVKTDGAETRHADDLPTITPIFVNDLNAYQVFLFYNQIRIQYFLLFYKYALAFFESLEQVALDYHNHLGSGASVTDGAGNEVFRIT